MLGSVVFCKAFLVDWDGTLLDTLPLKINNAVQLFSSRLDACPDTVRASYRRNSGHPRRELFNRIAFDCVGHHLDAKQFDALSRDFSEANIRTITANGMLRAHVRVALGALRQKNCLLFVSSSASQGELLLLARHFGLESYFLEILGSRVGFSKGEEHTRYIATKYNIAHEKIAGVGDESHDVRLHRAAGIMAIGITGTENRTTLLASGADLVVDDLRELVAYAQ